MPKPSATVAVITRTKDRPVFLIRAIQSVLKQSFQDWLHVIVNDGGDSGTVDALVKCHAHAYGNRVKVIHHAQSKGMQEASNAAIRASESEYVVVHDDDDSWQPDFLQQTTDFLKNCGPDSTTRGVVTQTTQILEEVNSTGEIVELGRHPYIQVDYVTLAEMRKSNLFAPIAFLYRRAAHEQIGLFRQEFDVLGDHDFNLRFLRRFDIGVLPNYSANYHWRHRSMGNTVTAGVEKHRIALSRMKNAYQREYLDNPKEAVGLVDEIPMPPRQRQQDAGPLRIRTKNPLPAKALPNFLEEYSFKLLSLDIFDTALKRRCDHPRNVFALLAEKVAQFLPVTIPGFAALRELAERTARQQQGGEVTLDDIYRNLGQALSLDAATAEKIKAMELAIEDDLLFADPGILSLYKECVQRNIPVIFLSDMYLDSETLACWLEERGFADAKVIVSCEQGLSKHDGGLFEILIQQTGVAAGDILHLGDNLRSDYTRARIAGLQAWHYSQDFCYLPWYKQTEALEFTPGDTLSYRIMGTISKRGTQSPWSCDKVLEKLGYEAAGPLYFAFLHWVLKRAKVDGIKKLILLGRDGYYWEKTLDIFKAHGLCTVEYAYMHASRKVLNFASFKRLDDEAMAFLTTPNPSLRVKDFLSRAGLQPDRHVDAMAAAGFADPEQILTVDLGGSFIRDCYLQQLRVLFQQLEPDLCALFARDRAGVLRSLEQLDFDAKDCAIVDIGWLASSLRRFPAIVDDSGKTTVTGYYFGTWSYMEPMPGNTRLHSFFVHKGVPSYNEALVRESVNFIESLHSAPFPTLLGLTATDKGSEPHFANAARTGGFDAEQQQQLWQGAESFIEDLIQSGISSETTCDSKAGFMYLQLIFKRLICEPAPEEISAWGGLEHSEGFGSEVLKPLVQKVAADIDGESLLKAYQGSNWKRGFLSALPTAQREFVVNRTKAAEYKSYQDLYNDLQYKIREADDLWAANNRLRLDLDGAANQLEQTKELLRHWQQRSEELETQLGGKNQQLHDLQSQLSTTRSEIFKLSGDLEWKNQQAHDLWTQQNEAKYKLQLLQDRFQELTRNLENTAASKAKLEHDLEWKNDQAHKLWAQHNAAVHELEALKNTLQSLERRLAEESAVRAQLQSELTELRAIYSSRWKIVKHLISGRS